MDSGSFREALDLYVRRALNAADNSLGVGEMEPGLVDLVALVNAHPERASEADGVLASLVPMLCQTPPPTGLVDLLGYCVHALELPCVLESARERRREALEELGRGLSRRPWEHARRCEQVIEASDPDWEDRELFPSLSN